MWFVYNRAVSSHSPNFSVLQVPSLAINFKERSARNIVFTSINRLRSSKGTTAVKLGSHRTRYYYDTPRMTPAHPVLESRQIGTKRGWSGCFWASTIEIGRRHLLLPTAPRHCPVLCWLRPDSAPMCPGRAPETLRLSYDSLRLTPTHPVSPRSATIMPRFSPTTPRHYPDLPRPRYDDAPTTSRFTLAGIKGAIPQCASSPCVCQSNTDLKFHQGWPFDVVLTSISSPLSCGGQ